MDSPSDDIVVCSLEVQADVCLMVSLAKHIPPVVIYGSSADGRSSHTSPVHWHIENISMYNFILYKSFSCPFPSRNAIHKVLGVQNLPTI